MNFHAPGCEFAISPCFRHESPVERPEAGDVALPRLHPGAVADANAVQFYVARLSRKTHSVQSGQEIAIEMNWALALGLE